jgi:predicted Holliday junction resolvase-like endonuclease
MQKEVLDFYSMLRHIFGVCPCCGEIFRLSDCKLFQKKKPEIDWKEEIDKEMQRLENLEEKILLKIEESKEAARTVGRRNADKLVRKLDKIFIPLKLNCNDCKVIFHPIDFIVFNGMNNNVGDCSIKEILLIDKDNKSGQYLEIQKSISNAIQTRNYDWLTLRVENDGNIIEEE